MQVTSALLEVSQDCFPGARHPHRVSGLHPDQLPDRGHVQGERHDRSAFSAKDGLSELVSLLEDCGSYPLWVISYGNAVEGSGKVKQAVATNAGGSSRPDLRRRTPSGLSRV